MYTIRRSNTGTYHKAMGNNSAACNGRGRLRTNACSQAIAEEASPSMFCRVCFPKGKPESFAKYF